MKKATLILIAYLIWINIAVAEEIVSGQFNILNCEGKTSVPFVLADNLIVVKVRINGSEDLNFIVDTGFTTTILFTKNQKVSRQLRLPKKKRIVFSGTGSSNPVYGHMTNPVDIHLGGLWGEKVGVLLVDKDMYLEEAGLQIHGIIGFQLFYQYVVKINYSDRVLTFYHDSIFFPDENDTEADISIENHKPYIYTSLKPSDELTPLKLLIDLGACYNLLLYTDQQQRNNIRMGKGLSGEIYGQLKYLKGFALWGKNLDNTPVWSIQRKDYAFQQDHLQQRDGVIGNALLQNYEVTFHYIRQKLYINNGCNTPAAKLLSKS